MVVDGCIRIWKVLELWYLTTTWIVISVGSIVDMLVLSWVGWIVLHQLFHHGLVLEPIDKEQTEAREAVEEEGDLTAKSWDEEATEESAKTSTQAKMQAFGIEI